MSSDNIYRQVSHLERLGKCLAGIGVWYADGSRRNKALKIENQEDKYASNSRAELSAILEALRQTKQTTWKYCQSLHPAREQYARNQTNSRTLTGTGCKTQTC